MGLKPIDEQPDALTEQGSAAPLPIEPVPVEQPAVAVEATPDVAETVAQTVPAEPSQIDAPLVPAPAEAVARDEAIVDTPALAVVAPVAAIAVESLNPVPVSSGSPMSTTSQSLPYNQAPTNAQRPGERLRQARLYQQRELKEIASELNISERLLIAIEADEYKSLPEPAFIRGYLRSYARYLGIDSDILIAQFNEIYTSATGLSSNHSLENSPLQQLAKLQSKKRTNNRWIIWVIAIPALLVVIVLLLWPIVKKVMSSTASHEQAPSVVLNSDSQLNSPQSSNVLPSVTSAPLSTMAAATAVATALPPVSQAPVNDQLVLTLTKGSGVNVQDSTGKTLISGQQSPGAPLTLTGISPFSITLDDADSVALSLNGEKVDLKPYTVQGKAAFRIAR